MRPTVQDLEHNQNLWLQALRVFAGVCLGVGALLLGASCATSTPPPAPNTTVQVELACDLEQHYHVLWDEGRTEYDAYTWFTLYEDPSIPGPELVPRVTVYLCDYECYGRTCDGQIYCPGLDLDQCTEEAWIPPKFDCVETSLYSYQAGSMLVLCGSKTVVSQPTSYDLSGIKYNTIYIGY